MPSRRAVIATFALAAGLLTVPSTVTAESDNSSPPEEHEDEAIPGTAPADNRPTASTEGDITIMAAPAGATAIEDFWYDELELEGTASEICAGRLLTGTGWAFNEVVSRFGGLAGSMYSCRERWDAANDPDCNGTVVNPATNPTFFSTCWSNHAKGRAFDVMVGGSAAAGYNRTRGLAIVNWLLATDSEGNVNANARRLGVQQILFTDRCWNSDGDRGIISWSKMRECGIGHNDHVHVDMTVLGAAGTVSFWGAAPRPPVPKPDTQVFWDVHGAWRQTISWWNLLTTDEEGLALPAGYDRAIVGDWDSNGEQGEIFLWDRDTGSYFVQEWSDGDSLNARMGSFSAGIDEIIAGDWDSDGEFDDMFLWDANTGNWNVFSWDGFEPTYRRRGTWTTALDDFTAGDFDGNGRVDDLHVWDHTTGNWNVFSWRSFRPIYRSRGVFATRYDELVVGDLSAGGEMDEAIVWDRQTGSWVLHHWINAKPFHVRGGSWSVSYDIAAPGDYDTDGRVDDIFLYDTATGVWALQSFHRNVPTLRRTGDWASKWDVISVGPFNE